LTQSFWAKQGSVREREWVTCAGRDLVGGLAPLVGHERRDVHYVAHGNARAPPSLLR